LTSAATFSTLRSRFGELFHEHLGVASALVVFLAATGWQVLGRTFAETTLRLKIGKSLRRERDQFAQAEVARFVLHKLDQLSANALVLVRRIDIKAGQLAFIPFAINVQRHASDGIFV